MKKVDVTDVAKKIMELYYLGDELYQSPFYSEKTLLIDECSPVTGPGSDTEKGQDPLSGQTAISYTKNIKPYATPQKPL